MLYRVTIRLVRLVLIFVVVLLTGAACRIVLGYADEWTWGFHVTIRVLLNTIIVLPLITVGILSIYGLFKGRD